MLIANLPLCLIKEEPLQKQQEADRVVADSLCLFLGLSPDLAMDVETCMMPAEDLLHQNKPDELFPNQQGEDLMGEKFLDNLVMEAGDMVESAIRGCVQSGIK